MGEVKGQGADLVGRTSGHAGSASDDGRRARVSLGDGVDIEDPRADLGQTADAGQDRGDLPAESGVLTAVADLQGDCVAQVIDQRNRDGGVLLGTGVETADGEGARGDTGVEDDAARVHHIRVVDTAVSQGVLVLEEDRTVDDRGRSGESIGSAEGEHAVANLGQAAGEAFAGVARGRAVADRARELDVIAVGIEQDGADERDAARDGARTGGDVGRRARRPADGAALDSQAARAGAVTGRGAVRQDLESAAGVQDQAALEGVRARERDRRADDVDTGLVAAGDVRSEVEDATTAAEAEEASHARGVDARVSDVAHAGAEAHAREVETGTAEVDIGRSGRGRDGDGAGAGRVGETVDLRERVRGICDDGAALRDHEEAAGFKAVEGRRIERAAPTDGDGAAVDCHGGGEGVDAGEGECAVAGLGQATGAVRRVQGRDRHRSTGAAAAREGDGRDGASHIGTRAGDHDARDLSARDDRVTSGGCAARHEAGGAEGDGRGTDVAGAAGDRKVGLREAGARGGGEASQGDRETVGVDRDDARAGSRARDGGVIDRTKERVGPEAVRSRDPIVSGEVGTARVLE